MISLAFAAPALTELRSMLLADASVETAAIILARRAGQRLLVVRTIVPSEADYLTRTPTTATLSPTFVFEATAAANAQGLCCIFAHSHPFDEDRPAFSGVDDRGEVRLAEYLNARVPNGVHCAMVVSPGGQRARVIGTRDEVMIVEVGAKLVMESDALLTGSAGRFDRQIRAFGAEGQRRIGVLRVGVVGAGGTGSITIQQLAHLGVSRFTLIDFDDVEPTNLNRLVGAGPNDVGRPKVDVAVDLIRSINPAAEVEAVIGDVADDHVARRLLTSDVVILCTDSHASRAVVNQLAYQYLIPALDMGVSMNVRNGRLAYVTGRVQLLVPGQPCLTCMNLLDSETIRREMMTSEARAADPYIVGAHEPQPSVISLNGTMASLAVTMFIGLVTDAPVKASLQIYDGIRGTVRNSSGRLDEACLTCSRQGGLGVGDAWPLPTRLR